MWKIKANLIMLFTLILIHLCALVFSTELTIDDMNKTNVPCVPSTNFLYEDKVCSCDARGLWHIDNCTLPKTRRESCEPGQIIWQDCSQCICQETRQLFCTKFKCRNNQSSASPVAYNVKLESIGPWCTPYRSYYVECGLCVCSASGRTRDAHCVTDYACLTDKPPLYSTLRSDLNRTMCLPKVMYLFPCLHCLCSNGGSFDVDNCVEMCDGPKTAYFRLQCAPATFYRRRCNVCLCPNDGYHDNSSCTKTECAEEYKLSHLEHLRSRVVTCSPHTFTPPRCIYCECGSTGVVDESACLELDCIKDYEYSNVKTKCSPGEMMPVCIECFCPGNRSTSGYYCSRTCTIRGKMDVLQNVLRDSLYYDKLLEHSVLRQQFTLHDSCLASTVYMYRGRYCICPENGIIDQKLCTFGPIDREGLLDADKNSRADIKMEAAFIDFNKTCEPSTFVEFDCNTCFCSKEGKIDPKWCTYDDCESKKVIQESHKLARLPIVIPEPSVRCNAGAITKQDCNFCICPASGMKSDLTCTTNHCTGVDQSPIPDKFTCEPFVYYEVDCNICYCPRDGIKNVAKCTKNMCEKNFLRTNVCVPGQLFSDECNVCVCPPNGDKSDKVCTNHTCPDDVATWKKIFMLSQSILGNQVDEDTTRSLDVCFRGEEFTIGCNLCVCPEIGLRAYATCTPILCSENENQKKQNEQKIPPRLTMNANERMLSFHRSCNNSTCTIYNTGSMPEKTDCTPGTTYISRCQQCICPSKENTSNSYCRSIRNGTRCDQIITTYNHVSPVESDNENDDLTRAQDKNNIELTSERTQILTRYVCETPGRIMDQCFICECENKVIIEEQCFKNDAVKCVDAKPSFVREDDRIFT